MLSFAEPNYYVAGGNLNPDALSYVVRPADDMLFNDISAGRYAYVLTSRQMGKSSLMHRTAVRLHEAGIKPVLVDLTAIGANLTPEQWYFGIFQEIGSQLGLEDDIRSYWSANLERGPLDRFMHGLIDIVLLNTSFPIAIFVDEIDFVRSLPFPTDEFFAAIRRCFNSRSSIEEMNRLTFSLLGVATPADLIRNARTTPFNIGNQIELSDFTLEEAMQLASGLDTDPVVAQQKLNRIYYWTNGHPYLTQKICLAVSQKPQCKVDEIDEICYELFMTNSVRSSEDNLIFVRNTICKATFDLFVVLDNYAKVLSGKRILYDPADPIIAHLRLAGVIRVTDRYLSVRNRIYEYVFNRRWVNENMPDAELKRQKAAYLKGILRTFGFSMIGFIILIAFWVNANISNRRLQQARNQLDIALKRSDYSRALGDLTLAQHAINGSNIPRAINLLNDSKSLMGERFEWRYLWHLCHTESKTFSDGKSPVLAASATTDGSIAAISQDGILRFWNIDTTQLTKSIDLKIRPSRAVISQDMSTLVVATSRIIYVYDLHTGRLRSVCNTKQNVFTSLAVSNDGRINVYGDSDSAVVWDTHTGKELNSIRNPKTVITSVAISPDGEHAAVGYFSSDIIILTTGESKHTISAKATDSYASAMKFSPNGRLLSVGTSGGIIEIRSATDGRLITSWNQGAPVKEVMAYSPGEEYLASASKDLSVKLSDVVTGVQTGIIYGHTGLITSISYYTNSKSIDRFMITGSMDGSVKLWKLSDINQYQSISSLRTVAPGSLISTKTSVEVVHGYDGNCFARDIQTDKVLWKITIKSDSPFTMLPDETELLTAYSTGIAEIRDVVTGNILKSYKIRAGRMLALSSNGNLISIMYDDNTIDLWDMITARKLYTYKSAVKSIIKAILSKNGKWLLIHNSLGQAEVKSTIDPSTSFIIAYNNERIVDCNFSADSHYVAAATDKGTIYIYTIPRWRLVGRISLGQNISILAFSSDNKSIVTAQRDGTIDFWDISTGEQTISLRSAPDIDSVSFSPDASTLAAITSYCAVYRWRT